MKKIILLWALAFYSVGTVAATPVQSCEKLIDDGMTLTAYISQCAAFGNKERYYRFVEATANNLHQVNMGNCQETVIRSKNDLPHRAVAVIGKERTTEVLEFCVAERKHAEQLLQQYGS